MANSASTGTTAAASPFNLNQAQRLLHRVVYGRFAVAVDAVSHDDYHQFAQALQAVDDAAHLCQRTSAGLSMLVDMMETFPDMPEHAAHAMQGLLIPIATELERHAQALAETITNPETKKD